MFLKFFYPYQGNTSEETSKATKYFQGLEYPCNARFLSVDTQFATVDDGQPTRGSLEVTLYIKDKKVGLQDIYDNPQRALETPAVKYVQVVDFMDEQGCTFIGFFLGNLASESDKDALYKVSTPEMHECP